MKRGREPPTTANGVFICAIFAERNAKFCFRCEKILREITTLCAILRKNHFAQNFVIPHLRNLVLRNSAISQCSLYIMIHFLEKKVSQSLDKFSFGQFP